MIDEKHLKTIAAGAGIALIGILFGRLISYITRIFIARFVGPAEYGVLSLGLAVADIVVIVSVLGMSSVVSSMASYYISKEDKSRAKGSIISSLYISIPISIILSLILFVSADYINSLFFNEPLLTNVIRILAVAVPGLVIMEIMIGAFSGLKAVKYKVYSVDIARNVSMLVLVLIFALLGAGIIGITAAWALGIGMGALAAVYFLSKIVRINLKEVKSYHVTRELLTFSWPLMFIPFITLTMKWTDTLMLGYFGEAAAVGIYNTAMITADIPRTLILSLGLIFIPVISGLYSKKDFAQIKKIYKTVTKWIFLVGIPILAVLVAFPDFIITFLFGGEYSAGATVLAILSTGLFISMLFEVSTKTLISIQKTKINLLSGVVGMGSNIILNLVLIPTYGMLGAAIGTTISLILWGIVSAIFVYKYIGVQPIHLQYIRPLIASFISTSLVYLTHEILPMVNAFITISLIALSFILYSLIILIIKGLSKEDVMVLKMIEERSGIRMKWLKNTLKRLM